MKVSINITSNTPDGAAMALDQIKGLLINGYKMSADKDDYHTSYIFFTEGEWAE